jgi:hypothetical protein
MKCRNTQRHVLEDTILHSQCCGNLKSNTDFVDHYFHPTPLLSYISFFPPLLSLSAVVKNGRSKGRKKRIKKERKIERNKDAALFS